MCLKKCNKVRVLDSVLSFASHIWRCNAQRQSWFGNFAGADVWLLAFLVDEFQLVQEQAAEMGLPDDSRLSKELVQTLCCFTSSEQDEAFKSDSPVQINSQHLRMVLLPIMFGEILQ